MPSGHERPGRVSVDPQTGTVGSRTETSGATRSDSSAPAPGQGRETTGEAASATAPMSPVTTEHPSPSGPTAQAAGDPLRAGEAPARHVSVRNPTRRLRQRLKRVSPFSVIKLSLFYYLLFLAVWLGIVALLYALVNGLGLFDLVRNVGKGMEISALKRLDISLGLVERWALIVGLVLVVLGSILNGFLAVLYNLGADLTGGLEVTIVERETYRR